MLWGETVTVEDDRQWNLGRDISELASKVSRMEAELVPLKEGVSNFRLFQARGSRYFDRAEGALDATDRRRKSLGFWLKIVAPLIISAMGFVSYQVWNFTGDLVKIVHEYHESHKSEFQQKSFFDGPPAVYASSNESQYSDSGQTHWLQ